MRRLVVIFFLVVAAGMAVGVAGAESARSSLHSQVVDSASKDRFEADESWGKGSYGRDVYGESYRFARPAEDGTLARFEVEIPETAEYAVYARWPEVEGLNDSVPIGVETASGLEWKRVDQRQDGGRWVRIGIFELEEGEGDYVGISPETDGEGYVVADAVKVVQVSPGNASSEKSSSESDTRSDASRKRSESARSAEASSKGQEVVRKARKYMGVKYRLGGVSSRSGIDCSGLTLMVYRKFGASLPHWDEKQYRYGAKVQGTPKPGDLVFFDEHGDGISHVGIYSGNGKLIHASDYYNRVVESEMKHLKGYKGARRLL